jgi:predicted nucleic acid-binding protein
MIFTDLAAGDAVFLDANTLIYHFTNNPKYGAACTALVERIEQKELQAFTSAHCLAEVAHRLMTIAAMNRLNWPASGLAARMKKLHAEIPKLSLYQQAITKVGQLGIHVLPITEALVLAASNFSQQFELLTGDSLVVAVMRQHGLTSLANEDADFDRATGSTRYAPV